jgi:probable F420-dependent oxidoreductase
MKFGFSLSNNQGIDDVHAIVRLAIRAEELGFDSVWASDHIFNVSYVFERIGDKPYYDPLTILSYVAAVTTRIRLGTSVLVLPYHHPMRLAKAAATLDVLSGGRLILGVGVGVIEQEFNALGSAYADRGAITDEAIAIMQALWTQEVPSHDGRLYRFSGMPFAPKPVQKPYIPIVIGGVRPGRDTARRPGRERLAPYVHATRGLARAHALSGGAGPGYRSGGGGYSRLHEYLSAGRAGRTLYTRHHPSRDRAQCAGLGKPGRGDDGGSPVYERCSGDDLCAGDDCPGGDASVHLRRHASSSAPPWPFPITGGREPVGQSQAV